VGAPPWQDVFTRYLFHGDNFATSAALTEGMRSTECHSSFMCSFVGRRIGWDSAEPVDAGWKL